MAGHCRTSPDQRPQAEPVILSSRLMIVSMIRHLVLASISIGKSTFGADSGLASMRLKPTSLRARLISHLRAYRWQPKLRRLGSI